MPASRSAPKTLQIAAAVVGNALEWYDFIIFGFLTVVISRLFFPVSALMASGSRRTLIAADMAQVYHISSYRTPRPPIATRLRSGGRARIRGCRFLNAETRNINVPGMLFLPADGVLPAKLRDEGPKL